VIPTSLLGIVAFAATVGPGYLYVRVAEQWRPLVERTPLKEAAELFVVGSIATALGVFVALVLVTPLQTLSAAPLSLLAAFAMPVGGPVTVACLVVADQLGQLDVGQLISSGGSYALRTPRPIGAGVLTALVVSYGAAWTLATVIHRGRSKIYPDSAWYGAFERDLPKAHGIFATVELTDGRAITGAVRSFTAEQGSVDDREITLHAPADRPLEVREVTGKVTSLSEDFILLRGSDIRYIAAQYAPLAQ